MMIDLQFINEAGDQMNAIHNKYMTLTAIEGLHGVDIEMSSTTSPYFDGDSVEHLRVNPRAILMTYSLTSPIPEALDYFNSIVKSKQLASLVETKEDGNQTKVEGIVTIQPYTRWSNNVSITVQLYCSQPYWKDIIPIVDDITHIIDSHYFPFDTEVALQEKEGGLVFLDPSIDTDTYTDEFTRTTYQGVVFGTYDENITRRVLNDGDITVGARITIVAFGEVTNPTIINQTTRDWIQVNRTLKANDFIEINTQCREKYARLNGEDIWDDIQYSGNDWLQIVTGYNELTGASDHKDGEVNNNFYFNVECRRGWQ